MWDKGEEERRAKKNQSSDSKLGENSSQQGVDNTAGELDPVPRAMSCGLQGSRRGQGFGVGQAGEEPPLNCRVWRRHGRVLQRWGVTDGCVNP